MKLTKVNKSYDLANDLVLVQVNFAVPMIREDEIREKLERLADWFMDKEKIKQKDILHGASSTN